MVLKVTYFDQCFVLFRAIMALFTLAVPASQTLNFIDYENLSSTLSSLGLKATHADRNHDELLVACLEGGTRVASRVP